MHAQKPEVKALETELGVTLFARTSRRVELTEAGEAFLPAARARLEAAERAAAAAAAAAAATGRVRGPLRVGVIPTITAVDLPALLGTFHRMHPHVRIALQAAGSDELESAIIRDDIDVGVLGLPETVGRVGSPGRPGAGDLRRLPRRDTEFGRLRLMKCGACEHQWRVTGEWLDSFDQGLEVCPSCGIDCTDELRPDFWAPSDDSACDDSEVHSFSWYHSTTHEEWPNPQLDPLASSQK